MPGFLRHIDHVLFYFFNRTIANPVFDFLCPVLRNAQTWIPLYVLLGIYLIRVFKKEAWVYISYILIAFALSDSICFQLLKPWFGRLRPCHDLANQGRLLLNSCGGLWGFPSNHASNHMAIALSIVLAGIFRSRLINAAWIAWAFVVAFSQVYVGVHFPADVVAGCLFGAVVAILNYKFILPNLKRLHLRFSRNT